MQAQISLRFGEYSLRWLTSFCKLFISFSIASAKRVNRKVELMSAAKRGQITIGKVLRSKVQIAGINFGDGDTLEIKLALRRFSRFLLVCLLGGRLDVITPEIAARALRVLLGVEQLQTHANRLFSCCTQSSDQPVRSILSARR